MNIQELIALCEAAEGPDRWIDAHIHGIHFKQEISVNEGGMVLTDHCVLGWIDPGKEKINFNPSGIGEKMLRYSESVDAAIALAERVLPGWGGLLSLGSGTSIHCADLWSERRGNQTSEDEDENPLPPGEDSHAEHASLPIAMVLAVLNALSAKEPSQ